MDIRRLNYFACIIEEGSITAAAQRVHVSQPALTKAMRTLEEELGVVLFERTIAGIFPTTFGQALYGRARAIIAEMQSAEQEIAALRGLAGERLRLGALPTLISDIVPAAVNDVSRRFPGLHVSVQEGHTQGLFRAMRRRELDLCLVYAGNLAADHGFGAQSIFLDRLVTVGSAAHPLAQLANPTVADVAEYPWCAATAGNWPVIERLLRSVGLDPPAPQVDPGGSIQFIKQFVGQSRHLAMLPARTIASEIDRGELTIIAVPGLSLEREIVALFSSGELSRGARAMLAALARYGKISADTGQ
ncbi:LysR family transcriptional regulator [Sphingomonas sp. MG17]|uniref:LysR family transcriptional regulator n=1 Tax=Sphingomonas tagetis TaxID=2949092 RepID=A0A9X2HS58_9SPHN|nr:LysR family transcriptional regulator [Sphingomonas tagetis]